MQLLAALKILDRGDITLDRMIGSWAGAMGHVQFIPSTYESYAVDFDGDGRRDIWHSMADVFASAANYLSSLGWNDKETWGREVRLPADFDFSQASLMYENLFMIGSKPECGNHRWKITECEF